MRRCTINTRDTRPRARKIRVCSTSVIHSRTFSRRARRRRRRGITRQLLLMHRWFAADYRRERARGSVLIASGHRDGRRLHHYSSYDHQHHHYPRILPRRSYIVSAIKHLSPCSPRYLATLFSRTERIRAAERFRRNWSTRRRAEMSAAIFRHPHRARTGPDVADNAWVL